MELYLNLIRQYKQNYLRIALGIAMLGLSAYTILNPSQLDSTFNSYVPVFIIAGIAYITFGLGINPMSFFGKAYIKIDKNTIEVKKNVFSKAWVLNWSDISEIQIKVASVRLISSSTSEILYDRMSEEAILELKTAVIGVAKDKNIKIN